MYTKVIGRWKKAHERGEKNRNYLRRAEIGLFHCFSIVNLTRFFFLAVASSGKLRSRKSTFQQCHYCYGCLNTGCVKLDLSSAPNKSKERREMEFVNRTSLLFAHLIYLRNAILKLMFICLWTLISMRDGEKCRRKFKGRSESLQCWSALNNKIEEAESRRITITVTFCSSESEKLNWQRKRIDEVYLKFPALIYSQMLTGKLFKWNYLNLS